MSGFSVALPFLPDLTLLHVPEETSWASAASLGSRKNCHLWAPGRTRSS